MVDCFHCSPSRSPNMNDHDQPSSRMRCSLCAAVVMLCLTLFMPTSANAAELTYPQLIQVRYEALDQRLGGHFVVWVEREKIWYGLDPRLYPAAKAVEVTHITPDRKSTRLNSRHVSE